MAATDWNYLEQKPPPQQPQTNNDLSWDDFSQFYQTANDWDYPTHDRQSLKIAESANRNGLINHDDMFKNHGSRGSMDILADDMGKKWNYDIERNTDRDNNPLLPKDNTVWNQSLSNTAQASVTVPDEALQSLQHHKQSITDAQGIDVSDDGDVGAKENDDRDEQISELKAYIQQIETEKKELLEDNQRLKQRNSELRKTLHKAQQYRRKSSIAVHNLMNINDKITNMQQENIVQDGKSEEKVREEEEINNLKIQEQIQQAIAMFQEEFGAELDEELNNIESFQYESVEEDSTSDHVQNIDDSDIILKVEQFEDEPFKAEAFKDESFKDTTNDAAFHTGALGVDFRIKFTDASSNQDNKENKPKDVHKEYRYVDEMDDNDDDDALPDSFSTPGGPSTEYITPGGPQIEDINNANVNEEKMIAMESRLNSLSDRVLSLMERIEQLTDRNQHLELSKMHLITNTSDAMNEYRDTIRILSQQNELLRTQIK